jgi:hypothetical protein
LRPLIGHFSVPGGNPDAVPYVIAFQGNSKTGSPYAALHTGEAAEYSGLSSSGKTLSHGYPQARPPHPRHHADTARQPTSVTVPTPLRATALRPKSAPSSVAGQIVEPEDHRPAR